jgi:CHAT domain-containing protein
MSRLVYGAAPKRRAVSPTLLASKDDLRVLVVASNTKPRIDGVDCETNRVHEYFLAQEYIPVRVELLSTEEATYERFRKEIVNEEYDIVHYAGHGTYNSSSPEESKLFFWEHKNKQGSVVEMHAAELAMLLERSSVRFMYLSSCNGTTSGDGTALLDDDFLGLADAIVQAGVPSVLGFRWPVSDVSAPRLALAFYQSLLKQGRPDIALWEARRELASTSRNDPTWLSPILIHQA